MNERASKRTSMKGKPAAGGPAARSIRTGAKSGRAIAADASPEEMKLDAADVLGGPSVLSHRVETSLDAHELLKEGLPARALTHLVEHVGLLRDGGNFTAALGMSPRTRQRKETVGAKRLSREQSGRAWKFAEVLAKATDVFGSQERAEAWLTQPAMALDRRTPLELLDTVAGLKLVEDLLIRLDYGVYT